MHPRFLAFSANTMDRSSTTAVRRGGSQPRACNPDGPLLAVGRDDEAKLPTMSMRLAPGRKNRTVQTWRAPGPLAMALIVAVLLAGCAGSPSKGAASRGSTTTTSAGSAAQAPVAGALRFASCMRSNGVTNYPDPNNNERPLSRSQVIPSSPTFLRAYNACREFAPSGVGGPPSPTAAQLRASLAFAQCMRKHGFPQFPDPLAAAPGASAYFTIGRGMYFPPSAQMRSGLQDTPRPRRSARRPRPAEWSFDVDNGEAHPSGGHPGWPPRACRSPSRPRGGLAEPVSHEPVFSCRLRDVRPSIAIVRRCRRSVELTVSGV